MQRLASLSSVDDIVSEIHKTARVIIPIVAIMALGVYILGGVAISLLFTDAFRSARDLFAIQLTGDVIKIASWLFAYPMLSRGATKWFMGTEIIFALSLVILTYFFVSKMGLKGAAVAYLVNYSLYFIITFLNVKNFAR